MPRHDFDDDSDYGYSRDRQFENSIQSLSKKLIGFTDQILTNIDKSLDSVVFDINKTINKSRNSKSTKSQLNKTIESLTSIPDILGDLNIEDIAEKLSESASRLNSVNASAELDKITDNYKTMILSTMSSLNAIDKTKLSSAAKNILSDLENNLNSLTDTMKIVQDSIVNAITIKEQKNKIIKEYLNIFDSVFSYIEKIPLFDLFSKLFPNIQHVKNKLKTDLTQILDSAITITNGKVNISIDAIKNGFMILAKSLKPIFSIIFNPAIISMSLIVGTLALAYNQLSKIDEETLSIQDNTNLTNKSMSSINKILINNANSMREYNIGVKELSKSIESIYEGYSTINVLNKDLLKTTALLNKLNIENAGQFLSMTLLSKQNTDKIAKNSASILVDFSEIMGIAPNELFKEINENSELISKYMGNNLKNITKTVIEARKLGLSLSDVSKIVNKIMDWESSIENEMNLTALLGKQIDFNTARYKIFNKNVEGGVKDIINQIGSLETFNNLNSIQQEAIADAIGLSIDELLKMYKQQEIISKMTVGQRQEFDKISKQLSNINNETVDSLINQKKYAVSTQSVEQSFKNILGSLAQILTPILNVLAPTLEFIANLISNINTDILSWVVGLTLAGFTLYKLFKGVMLLKGIMSGFSLFGAGGAAAGAAGALGGTAKTISSGIGSAMSSFSKINPVSLIKGATAILILGGALVVFAYGLKQFNGIDFESMMIGLSGVATALLIFIPALIVLGQVATTFSAVIVPAFLLLAGIGGVLMIFAFALSLISKSMIGLADKSSGIASATNSVIGLTTALTALSIFNGANSIFSIVSGNPFSDLIELADNAPKFEKLAVALGSVATSLLTISKVPSIDLTGINNINTDKLNEIKDNQNKALVNELSKKLDNVVDAIKHINIYLDNKKVNTQLATNSISNRKT